MSSNDNTPKGQRLREAFNIVEEKDAKDVQLRMLDDLFQKFGQIIERVMDTELDAASKVAQMSHKPEETFVDLIEHFTITKQQDGSGFSPVMTLQIPMNICLTNFTKEDIRSLPGYIALHKKAREMDVAINASDLIRDEVQELPSGQIMPPTLTMDVRKSYEEGLRNDHDNMAPDLPANFNPKQIGHFDLKKKNAL